MRKSCRWCCCAPHDECPLPGDREWASRRPAKFASWSMPWLGEIARGIVLSWSFFCTGAPLDARGC